MTTLYAAAEAADACEEGLRQARDLGLEDLPCSLEGWRAARAAGLDEGYLAWAVRLLSARELLAFAKGPLEVRRSVAAAPACGTWLLTYLAEDEDPWVLVAVASHPNCPVETVRTLIKSRFSVVRLAAAGNLRCPVDALLAYLPGATWGVREGVALRAPLYPAEVRRQLRAALIDDPNPAVRDAARRILED